MRGYLLVISTTNSQMLAEKIANHLLDNKLAACVNIIPNIRSIYKWKDEICRDSEFLLLIKTTANHFEKIKHEISSLHTYEVPEIIALPIEGGNPAYLEWIENETRR